MKRIVLILILITLPVNAFWGTRPDTALGSGSFLFLALMPWFNQNSIQSQRTDAFDSHQQTFWNIYNNTPHDLLIITPCGSTRIKPKKNGAISHEHGLNFIASIPTARISCTTKSHNLAVSSHNGQLKIEPIESKT